MSLAGRPILGAALTLGALLGAYAIAVLVTGSTSSMVDESALLGVDRGTRGFVVTAVLCAYTAGMNLRERRCVPEDLREVLRSTDRDDPGLSNLLERLQTSTTTRIATVAIGAGFGLGVYLFAALVLEGQLARVDYPRFQDMSAAAINMALFAVLIPRARETVVVARVFSEIGRRYFRVSLLDPETLVPFSRRGVRLAATWLVGSALASLIAESSGSPLLVISLIAVTLGLGVASLVAPAWGVHERIRAEKQAELGRVRAAIAKQGEAALSAAPGAASEDAAPLPSLVAYEARLEAVREWPFGGAAMARVALLFLIPLASWIGGALVERAVDLALE